MKNIIYLNEHDEISKCIEKIASDYKIEVFHSFQKAVLYLLDHGDVAYFIIEHPFLSDDLKEKSKALSEINAFLPVVLVIENISVQEKESLKNNHSITVIQNAENLLNELKEITPNRRRANRVYWPLNAEFYSLDNPSVRGKGEIISLSTLGVYIKTEDFYSLSGSSIRITIRFANFEFEVDGVLQRLNKEEAKTVPVGFALEFIHISPTTLAYIQSAVTDHLYQHILSRFRF